MINYIVVITVLEIVYGQSQAKRRIFFSIFFKYFLIFYLDVLSSFKNNDIVSNFWGYNGL